jgi:carbon-monoxide dehydrogenase medium subunit
LLAGQRAEPGTFAAAAEAAQLEIEPWNDLHASADYRRRITGVLLRRALAATSCTHDAGGPAGG